jgi:hypothetical protein
MVAAMALAFMAQTALLVVALLLLALPYLIGWVSCSVFEKPAIRGRTG